MAKITAGKWTYTETELDEMQDQAATRFAAAEPIEMRALAARYDQAGGRLTLELENGATVILPVESLQGLSGAGGDALGEVELWSNGAAVHWEQLDADFLVADLVRGVFGGKTWMRELREHYRRVGAKGGAVKSGAKIKASRENGRKGGRPRKGV